MGAKKSVHDFRFWKKNCLEQIASIAKSRESALRRFADEPVQMPSLAFNTTFTACGLALPPVAFITCPTNQPSMVGFCFAWATLSGLAAMILSIAASIAPVSVTG